MKILNIWLKYDKKLRLVLDFAPLTAFFITYRLAGLASATAILVVLTIISLSIVYYRERKIALMPLISGIMVSVFGGLTLFLHDDTFIKIKPTIVNLIFATVLLVGAYIRKPALKYLLDDAIQLTDKGWLILSMRWGFFFIFLACLNEFIWRSFSTDFWVNFKVFGMFTLTMLFTASQLPLIKKHWLEDSQ